MNSKILVFGNGIIGSALSKHLSYIGLEVICAGRSWDINQQDSFSKIRFDATKLTDINRELSELKPTHSIIAFGRNRIKDCKQNSSETREVNVYATLRLIEHLEDMDCKTLVLSSSLIWDIPQGNLGLESQIPKTEYGKQKLLLEQGIQDSGFETRIVRLGKVISRNSSIINKIQGVLNSTRIETFYNNLMLSPVHISSVFDTLNLWLSEGIDRKINLVPYTQWSETSILRIAIGNRKLPFEKFYDIPLEIPNDELPSQVFCPPTEDVSPIGIYGIQAIRIELA
jgi:nucleoside-diphosphate-sugar epimerase